MKSEDENSNKEKSAIDQLIENIANNIDSTNAARERSDELIRKKREEMDEETKKEAKNVMIDNLKKTIRNSKEQLTQGEIDLMKSIGLDKVMDLPDLANEQWLDDLDIVLNDVLGTKGSSYNPNLPSRRVQGAFGRKERKKKLEQIVLAMDCSQGLGKARFEKALKYLKTFFENLSVIPECEIILWGGTIDPETDIELGIGEKDMGGLKTNSFNDPVKAISYLTEKGTEQYQGSGPEYVFQYLIKALWSDPDGIIFFTDGVFEGGGSTPSRETERLIRRIDKNLIWVLTSEADLAKITDFDPTVKAMERYVKQDN
ncbi:VWA domain-containing protein [Fuchsiella alkaliacetigena]|uniref:VWA domain-containing protein n=1 Tax=Fuchsiella alkaliacetigena TaxID=957042 RepID=UPI00200A4F75|nr:VWA domain-containing protein [Fuchsiella alkaliacetigena]MCK8826069.1 VWA domain-containing protein [Fuchsiella alkaliacetigena]